MNSGFLNRLVGTSIVVVAAIIFIPSILDGEKVHYKEGFKAIPDRPEFATVEIKQDIDRQAALAPEVEAAPVEDEIAVDELTTPQEQTVEVGTLTSESVDADSAQTQAQFAQLVDAKNNEMQESKALISSEPPQAPEAKPAKVIPAEKTIVEAKAESLVRDEKSNFTKMSYVIQLGSFSHKSNVEALLKKLKKNNFTAFTRPIKTPNGTLTKVFVGPDLDKKKLEAQLPVLKKLTKLNARITQFNITK